MQKIWKIRLPNRAHVAHAADLLPAEHRLRGRVHQHKQRRHITGADQEVLELSRRSQSLAAENRTGKQRKFLERMVCPMRGGGGGKQKVAHRGQNQP